MLKDQMLIKEEEKTAYTRGKEDLKRVLSSIEAGF
jgi:hypothetical protein